MNKQKMNNMNKQNNHKNKNNKNNLNLKPLLDKVSQVLEEGLQEIFNDFMTNYNIYEENYEAILALPIIQKLTKSLNEKVIIKMLQKENVTLRKTIKNLHKQKTEEHILLNIIDPEIVIKEENIPKVYETIVNDVENKEEETEEEEEEEEEEEQKEEEEEEEEQKEEED